MRSAQNSQDRKLQEFRDSETAGPVDDVTMPKEAMEVAVSSGGVPMKPLDKARTWHRAAAVALLNGVLGFLLLNLLLYLVSLAKRSPINDPLSQYGADKFQKAYPGWRKEDIKTLLRETSRDSTFEFEPFTDARERPFRGKYVNIDPAGFRFSKDQAPWPPRSQAFNVFVFGGSTTFGYGLPDDQTIASYLGECGVTNSSRDRLAVYNFGREGYFSSQELILFQQLIKGGFVPQVAVFIDGMNDFFLADGQPSFADKFRRLMDGQVRSTSPLDNVPVVKAFHWLSKRWRRPPPPPQKAAWSDADPAVMEGVVNRWLVNKRMIELMAAGFGVRPIFVWQPVPAYKYDLRYHFLFSDGSPIRRYPPVLYAYPLMENQRAQGKLGGNILWLADMQQDKHENLYVDAVHYNATFSKEIAAQICGFLNEPPSAK